MKYIWELVARAKSQELKPADIEFMPAKKFSPYLELSLEDLNDYSVPSVAEVNPYLRFLTVFKNYFNPDYDEDHEFRNELFNLIIHYLAELDTHMGITKRDYEVILASHDIESGLYGEELANGFRLFSLLEKKAVTANLLRLYTSNEGVHLFQDAVGKLYKKSTVYGNYTDRDVVMTHLLVEESEEHIGRIQVLKSMFLPCHYEVEIYWIHLFGIIGIDGAMKQEEMVMY